MMDDDVMFAVRKFILEPGDSKCIFIYDRPLVGYRIELTLYKLSGFLSQYLKEDRLESHQEEATPEGINRAI
jgi:hypothetical protein